jgi:hypothetical protein
VATRSVGAEVSSAYSVEFTLQCLVLVGIAAAASTLLVMGGMRWSQGGQRLIQGKAMIGCGVGLSVMGMALTSSSLVQLWRGVEALREFHPDRDPRRHERPVSRPPPALGEPLLRGISDEWNAAEQTAAQLVQEIDHLETAAGPAKTKMLRTADGHPRVVPDRDVV